MLVFDLSSLESFLHLEAVWIEDLKESLPDAILLLVGNKADRHGREVNKSQVDSFCQRFGVDNYHEVSALTGEGIVPRLV